MLCKNCKHYSAELDWCRIKLVGKPTGCSFHLAKVIVPVAVDWQRLAAGCRKTPSRNVEY